MSTHTLSSGTQRARERKRPGPGPVAAVVVLLLAFALVALAIVAIVAAQAADEARDDVNAGGVSAATHDSSTHDATANQALPLESFAGKTGANAEALAKAHAAYDATLPPIPPDSGST